MTEALIEEVDVLTEAEAHARVRRGADWLDRNIVSWDERVDLDILSISSCTRCMIAQLGGRDYQQSAADYDLSPAAAMKLGFVLDPSDLRSDLRMETLEAFISVGVRIDRAFQLLTAAWKQIIQARREARRVARTIPQEDRELVGV